MIGVMSGTWSMGIDPNEVGWVGSESEGTGHGGHGKSDLWRIVRGGTCGERGANRSRRAKRRMI